MPDNTTFQSVTLATPPSGTVVAADDVQVGGTQASGLVQFMKIVDGTLNGTDPIKGDSANGLDVDVTRLPTAGTATLSNVVGANADTALLAANAARKQAIIVNDSDAALYVKLGTGASLTSYSFFLPAQANGQKAQLELPLPVYTGAINGIWASATGNARVTELT